MIDFVQILAAVVLVAICILLLPLAVEVIIFVIAAIFAVAALPFAGLYWLGILLFRVIKRISKPNGA